MHIQSRDYSSGFLYGQPELFVGSLGDGLLASRTEALAVSNGGGGAGSGGGGVGSGGGVNGVNGDSMKASLRHDGGSFLHPHVGHSPSSGSSASAASQLNGRSQQVALKFEYFDNGASSVSFLSSSYSIHSYQSINKSINLKKKQQLNNSKIINNSSINDLL